MERAHHTNGPEDEREAADQAVQGVAGELEDAHRAGSNRTGLGQPITGAPEVPDEPDGGPRGDED